MSDDLVHLTPSSSVVPFFEVVYPTLHLPVEASPWNVRSSPFIAVHIDSRNFGDVEESMKSPVGERERSARTKRERERERGAAVCEKGFYRLRNQQVAAKFLPIVAFCIFPTEALQQSRCSAECAMKASEMLFSARIGTNSHQCMGSLIPQPSHPRNRRVQRVSFTSR